MMLTQLIREYVLTHVLVKNTFVVPITDTVGRFVSSAMCTNTNTFLSMSKISLGQLNGNTKILQNRPGPKDPTSSPYKYR